MQPASRRVKTIYSVIASPNRLEILRILNTKGPLSYSELKMLAGFKSKKESGKFAYHLRKLVRQMLVTLNRAERKYTATNLGRLILNLTRQIEEQSVLETGKLYVRTSRHTLEEFNSDKILQSLVREAGMPVELAQKITSETEARLYKFQTNYLTSPLIREMVNALLIEHGYEEYRHKLTRLGLPVYDVTELIDRVGNSSESIETILSHTAHAVFGEYLLLAQLQRDVADAHLAGDIHISNVGTWGLVPDTAFVDLLPLHTGGINLGSKLITTPRIPTPTSLEEAGSSFVLLASLVGREVSSEISFENYIPFFAKFAQDRTAEELKRVLRRTFLMIPPSVNQSSGKPTVSVQLSEPKDGLEIDQALMGRVIAATVEAYREYADVCALPQVRLVVSLPRFLSTDLVRSLITAVYAGGAVAFVPKGKTTRAYSGLRKTLLPNDPEDDVMCVLHALSLNLPRLAYESNRDETYFRAKLALLLQTSIIALSTRRKIIDEMMKKGILPTLVHNSVSSSSRYMPLVVNLIGLDESISNLLGEKATASARRSLGEKVVETAVRVATDRSEKIGERAGISMLVDDAAGRFAILDAEKYGKGATLGSGRTRYSSGATAQPEEITKEDVTEDLNWFTKTLNGGFSVALELSRGVASDEAEAIAQKAISRVEFFKLVRTALVCRNCGGKAFTDAGRCRACKSTSVVTYSLD